MSTFLAPPAPPGLHAGARPTFSVIMAAYQAADTIGAAIQSALDQTYPPLEVVVCDDGSTDDIDGALAPYRDRIVLVRKENGGEASAKNAAARAASGDFAVILDADDLFLPGRLEALAELGAARPDLDILTTDAILEVDGESAQSCYTPSFTFPTEDQRSEILRRNFVFGHAATRRELLVADGGFDETIRFTTDWERWIRLILGGARVGLVPEPLAIYKILPGSLSSQRSRMIEGRISTLEKTALNPLLSPSERDEVQARIEQWRLDALLMRAREALRDGHGDARARSFAVAREHRLPVGSRLKALLSGLAPPVARRLLERRGRETTAEMVLPPG